jgi:hypothetical protein
LTDKGARDVALAGRWLAKEVQIMAVTNAHRTFTWAADVLSVARAVLQVGHCCQTGDDSDTREHRTWGRIRGLVRLTDDRGGTV